MFDEDIRKAKQLCSGIWPNPTDLFAIDEKTFATRFA
jgi:hypothetical protein